MCRKTEAAGQLLCESSWALCEAAASQYTSVDGQQQSLDFELLLNRARNHKRNQVFFFLDQKRNQVEPPERITWNGARGVGFFGDQCSFQVQSTRLFLRNFGDSRLLS